MDRKKAIAVVILAAGQGRRFAAAHGGHKLSTPFKGKALIRHVAEAALASSLRPVIVVTGHAHEMIEHILDDLSVHFIHNPDYGKGLATSLQSALAVLRDRDGMIVLLGDMPLVSSALIEGLSTRFQEAVREPAVIFPSYHGQRGNPVLVGRKLFKAIAGLEGDEGARRLIESAKEEALEWRVEDASILIDVDTEDSLKSIV